MNIIRKLQNHRKNIKSVRREQIQDSLKLLMRVIKVSGMWPLKNVTELERIHFKFLSWSFFYSCFVLSTILLFVIFTFQELIIYDFATYSIVNVIHSCNVFIIEILFIRLAKRWPSIWKFWNEIDKKMEKNYGYPKNVTRKINIILIIGICISLGNQITVPYPSLWYFFNYGKFELPPFESWEGFVDVLLIISLFFAKAIVHYADIFIIVITIALTARFQQINQRIIASENKVESILFWREIREDYNRLSHLVHKLDDELAYIILFSIGFNCFWVTKLLYNTIAINYDYTFTFLYSFGFLILRFALVFEYCIELNVESRKASFIIQYSNLGNYNIEISRLLTQINCDNVYFSGCKLFKIKKGIILKLAGVILTYELTAFQYDAFYDA